MTERISDLMLEKLVLGELDDETSSRILSDLESRGELHRFEAIVADNEEFERRYSPPVIASQIAERARREQRVAASEAGVSRRPQLVLAAAAFALVALGVWAYSTQAPTADVSKTAGPARPDVPLPGPDEKSRTPTFEVSIVDPAGEFDFPQNLYMRVGETVTLRAPSARRIELSLAKLADVKKNDDETIAVTAKEAGRSMLRVIQQEQGPERAAIVSTFLSISDPFDHDELARLAETEPKITSCSSKAPGFRGVLRMGVVVQIKANLASLEFLDSPTEAPEEQLAALRSCVEDIVSHWEFQHDDWSSETLRINFATSEVCPRDEDC